MIITVSLVNKRMLLSLSVVNMHKLDDVRLINRENFGPTHCQQLSAQAQSQQAYKLSIS